MLYIVEDIHSSRGCGTHLFAVEADNEKEAEKLANELANEYIQHVSRVLSIPLFRTKMRAHKSFCPVIVTKENIDELINKNLYAKEEGREL